MRIFRLIITAIILFLIVIVGGFFLAREVLLYWGTSTVKSSLRELVTASTKNISGSQCASLGGSVIAGEVPVTYQLRFVTSSQYRIEAVCEGFQHDPILISNHTLPDFVTKVAGTSGFLLVFQANQIELAVFANEISALEQATKIDFSYLHRKAKLIAENGTVVKTPQSGVVPGPVTACTGYGYQCCNEVTHLGSGGQIVGLADCEQSCFASCITRPVLLSLNTNPLLDPKTRTITVPSGSPVDFTFVADAGNAETLTGTLDFGNGTTMPISGLAGQTSHTYECATSRCEYIASIVLEDSAGITSAQLQTSSVTIIVTGR